MAAPIAIVTFGWMSGLPALPIAAMRPSLMPMSAFHDAPVVEDHRIRHDGIHDLGMHALRLAHAVANHLAAAELDLFAVGREVALDLDQQFGVGEAHAVAGGGAEHLRVRAAANA
ncbi:hypothetical protein OKW32_003113 [Paraburkholderia youngii]